MLEINIKKFKKKEKGKGLEGEFLISFYNHRTEKGKEKETDVLCVVGKDGWVGQGSHSVCPQLFRPQDLGACWPDL